MEHTILVLTMALASSVAVANPLVGDINNTTTTAGNNAAIVANDLRNNLGVNDNNFSNTPTNISANDNKSSASAIGNKLDSKITSTNTNDLSNMVDATNMITGSNTLTGTVTGKNEQSTANANNSKQETSVNVQGDTHNYPRIPVSSAIAFTSSPSAPCMGSSGITGQGALFALGLSSTWESEKCMNNENIRNTVEVLGDVETAMAMKCRLDPIYKEARDDTGNPCYEKKVVATTTTSKVKSTTKRPF